MTAPLGVAAEPGWVEVCGLDSLTPGRGVCALVAGTAVAVFFTPDGALHAVGNHDPFVDASVLSRGLLGTAQVDGEAVAYVASPMRKHRFDLRTGRSLDDPGWGVQVWPVECRDGTVLVRTVPHNGETIA